MIISKIANLRNRMRINTKIKMKLKTKMELKSKRPSWLQLIGSKCIPIRISISETTLKNYFKSELPLPKTKASLLRPRSMTP